MNRFSWKNLNFESELIQFLSFESIHNHNLAMLHLMVQKINARFLHLFHEHEYILAAATHPKFKLAWARSEEKVRIKMRLEAAIGKQSQPILSPLSDDDFLSFDDRQPSIESELERYLNDKDKRLEMLDKYPNIKKLFMRYNTMLPSSAPVERLFSMAALVLTGKRANLSDTLLEHLILLKIYRNL